MPMPWCCEFPCGLCLPACAPPKVVNLNPAGTNTSGDGRNLWAVEYGSCFYAAAYAIGFFEYNTFYCLFLKDVDASGNPSPGGGYGILVQFNNFPTGLQPVDPAWFKHYTQRLDCFHLDEVIPPLTAGATGTVTVKTPAVFTGVRPDLPAVRAAMTGRAPHPGLRIRSETEQAECQAICRTNACGAYDSINDVCRRCGCASQRREVWLSKLRIGFCPKGLWPTL